MYDVCTCVSARAVVNVYMCVDVGDSLHICVIMYEGAHDCVCPCTCVGGCELVHLCTYVGVFT